MDGFVQVERLLKDSNPKYKCCLCNTMESTLFSIPGNENRYKEWFAALKWDVPPEKVKFVLNRARLCKKHFSEPCFSNTLKNRLTKFACPKITDDLSPQDIVSPQIVEMAASQSSPVIISDPELACSTTLASPQTAPFITSSQLQVTPKTRKIRNLLSNVSKLKKKLYEKRTSSRFLGTLKAQLADKPYLYEFVASQLRMQCRSSKGRRWTAKEKAFALQIYLHSPSAYKILRKYFAFPCKATLNRYTYNVAKTSGFCPNLEKCLKKRVSSMKEMDKFCVLLIDEMSIKQGLTFAPDLDSVDGFTTVKNHFHEKPPLASQALVFMARGIVKNWKQVIGYHFTSPSESFCLKELVLKAIGILHESGLEVVSIISDQGPSNQRLFNQLKVTKDSPFFWHNCKKIYAMYDPPHLIKSVRNNLKKYGIFFEDTIAGNQPRKCYASWDHIEKLYELDSNNKFAVCQKLTKQHIDVCGLKKMNVKLATQVLSHSVAAALNLHVAAKNIESKAMETAEFVWKMDKLFDSVNSRTLNHSKKELSAVTKDSFHISFWEEIIKWIETWHIKSQVTNRKIFLPCKGGWILTLKAFIGISEYLLTKVKFILTNHLNQDPLENTFSSLRRRGGFRDNPDAYEFRHSMHKVIISNFIKQSINKNCEDDKASNLIDFSSLNKRDLCSIINENFDDYYNENKLCSDDNIQITSLNIVEKNVLTYISGYLAKKFLSSHSCIECKNLLINEGKELDSHCMLLYFKEYDTVQCGLLWPTSYLIEYLIKLHECFSSNFNIFFEKDSISKKFKIVLSEVSMEFYDNHLEHKNEAQNCLISSFVRMMIKHNIKKINDNEKLNVNIKKNSKKKLKKVLHL